jgi:hypothetical protein
MKKRAATSSLAAGEPLLSPRNQDPADDLLCDLIHAELAEKFTGVLITKDDVRKVVEEMTGAKDIEVKFFELATGGSRCEVRFK